MKRCLCTLFSIVLCLYTTAVCANSKQQYQIELIVFSQLNKQGIDSEQWPPTPAFQMPDNKVISLIDKTGFDAASIDESQIQLLPPSQFRLSPANTAINRNPNYQTILHIAWIADMSVAKFNLPIHIQGGTYYTDNGDALTNVSTDDRSTLTPQVDGLISVKLDRYFDVTANLTFTAPLKKIASLGDTEYFNSLNTGLLHFQLLQSRRMRSNELNYFDFPIYGMVMQIYPLSTKQNN